MQRGRYFGEREAGIALPTFAELADPSTIPTTVEARLAGQYAAGARLSAQETDRSAFLATIAARWERLDPARYPFVRQVAAQLPGHDDREQFLAGINLILAGITAEFELA